MCNDLLENVENALVRNATTAGFLFATTAESPLVKNVVMATGKLPNVRNAFCHRTDILHRKALPSVAFVNFTCIFEIRNTEKLILFLKVNGVQIFCVRLVAILQALLSSHVTTDYGLLET